MAFSRKKVSSYRWPVTVFVPADGGTHDKQTLDVLFKRIPRTELENVKDNVSLLEKVIEGWFSYIDEAGKEIPFSAQALKELLDDTAFVPAAAKAYWESLQGGAQAGN
jgi:hypothetical protein